MQAVNNFHLKTKKKANGSTTYYAQTDAHKSQAYSFHFIAQNQSHVAGSALVAFAQPPSTADPNITYSISAKLSGLTPGLNYTAMLCKGRSGSGAMVPYSQFGTVTVNANGAATVTGFVQASGLSQGIWNLDTILTNKWLRQVLSMIHLSLMNGSSNLRNAANNSASMPGTYYGPPLAAL